MSNSKRPFLDLLLEQNKGRTADELTDAMHDLVTQVSATGKKGSLTLTLTVEPLEDDESMVRLYDAIALRSPQPARKPSRFFVAYGNLQREDPNQMKFSGIREVPTTTKPQTTPISKEA